MCIRDSLFTVDEETGLTGAFALQEGFMSGDILLNLDSEDEGEDVYKRQSYKRQILTGRHIRLPPRQMTE